MISKGPCETMIRKVVFDLQLVMTESSPSQVVRSTMVRKIKQVGSMDV